MIRKIGKMGWKTFDIDNIVNVLGKYLDAGMTGRDRETPPLTMRIESPTKMPPIFLSSVQREFKKTYIDARSADKKPVCWL